MDRHHKVLVWVKHNMTTVVGTIVHFYSLFVPSLYQLTAFGELIYDGRALTGGSTVLWDDVAG